MFALVAPSGLEFQILLPDFQIMVTQCRNAFRYQKKVNGIGLFGRAFFQKFSEMQCPGSMATQSQKVIHWLIVVTFMTTRYFRSKQQHTQQQNNNMQMQEQNFKKRTTLLYHNIVIDNEPRDRPDNN